MITNPRAIEILQSIRGRSLFYPCCGNDFREPISDFGPYVDDMWFVDIHCRRGGQFLECMGYAPESQTKEAFSGVTLERGERYEVDVVSQTYHKHGREHGLRLHFCRGRSFDAFRSVFDDRNHRLGVFYYRGDSPAAGEGSSGFRWLRTPRLLSIVNRLPDGGLLATDGSNGRGPLSRFHRQSAVGREAIAEARPFEACGRQFTCLDYLGQRYGPTLLWEVSPPLSGRGSAQRG